MYCILLTRAERDAQRGGLVPRGFLEEAGSIQHFDFHLFLKLPEAAAPLLSEE